MSRKFDRDLHRMTVLSIRDKVVYTAIGAKIVTQDGAEEGKFGDLPAIAEGSNRLFW